MLHSNNTMFERFCGKHGGYACLHYSVPLVLSVRNSRVCRRPKFWTLVPYHRHISFAPVSTWEFSFEYHETTQTELWCSGCGDRFNPCPNCHSPTPAFVTLRGCVQNMPVLSPHRRKKTWRTCFSAKIIVRKCHASLLNDGRLLLRIVV